MKIVSYCVCFLLRILSAHRFLFRVSASARHKRKKVLKTVTDTTPRRQAQGGRREMGGRHAATTQGF